MIDNTRALELIEDAERDARLCACGQPTVPVARAGGVWLTCSSLLQPVGPVRRLARLGFAAAHTDRLIFESSAVTATG